MGTQDQNFEEVIYSVIGYLEGQGFSKINAKVEEYDDPARIVRKGRNIGYQPDLVAKSATTTCVFEVESARDIKKGQVWNKWQLFADYATSNNGKFYLIIPEGKEELVRHLLYEMDIEADLLQMRGMYV